MKPVLIHRDARAELDEAMAFYEASEPGLGLDLQDKVEGAISKIRQNPETWPRHKSTEFRKYLLDRFPYTVFYLDQPAHIWIIAIAHARRKPNYWRVRVTR